MKMKELEKVTGVGRETIRFYIREGLLPEPERPKRNVATYGQAHVDRLKLIKRLQTERYLPLSVIRTVLETGREPRGGIDELIGLEESLSPLLAEGDKDEMTPLDEVAEKVGLDVNYVDRLAEVGMIRVAEHEGLRVVDERNARIVGLIGALYEAGISEENGYTTDYWQLYVDFMSWLAKREVTYFYGEIGSTMPQGASAQLAAAGIRHVNEFLPLLRTEMIVREIRRISELGRLPSPTEDSEFAAE